jgi:hypothetical protein
MYWCRCEHLHALRSLSFTLTLERRGDYYSHFTEEESEVQGSSEQQARLGNDFISMIKKWRLIFQD